MFFCPRSTALNTRIQQPVRWASKPVGDYESGTMNRGERSDGLGSPSYGLWEGTCPTSSIVSDRAGDEDFARPISHFVLAGLFEKTPNSASGFAIRLAELELPCSVQPE